MRSGPTARLSRDTWTGTVTNDSCRFTQRFFFFSFILLYHVLCLHWQRSTTGELRAEMTNVISIPDNAGLELTPQKLTQLSSARAISFSPVCFRNFFFFFLNNNTVFIIKAVCYLTNVISQKYKSRKVTHLPKTNKCTTIASVVK